MSHVLHNLVLYYSLSTWWLAKQFYLQFECRILDKVKIFTLILVYPRQTSPSAWSWCWCSWWWSWQMELQTATNNICTAQNEIVFNENIAMHSGFDPSIVKIQIICLQYNRVYPQWRRIKNELNAKYIENCNFSANKISFYIYKVVLKMLLFKQSNKV